MGESPESRPLARDLSIGCAVKRTATRNPFRRRKTVARKESCAGGRPPARCAGFGRSVGCARGSQSRLQKSTGGVWPVATRGEEPREPTSGLATPGESIGAAKARRKPGPRRQSRDTGGGFPPKTVSRKRALWEQPVDGRRSGSNKLHPLTRVWEKRSSVLRGESGQRDPATRGVRQRASEVLRQPGTRSTTPRRGGSHQGVAALGSTPHRSAAGSEARVVEGTEAGDRAVKRAPPGAGSSKGGLAPQSLTGFGPAGGGGRRGASHALGNQAIHGCSCRESVAEVGEEHLPHATEGSREANRGGAR
jgi:hypothetical protein